MRKVLKRREHRNCARCLLTRLFAKVEGQGSAVVETLPDLDNAGVNRRCPKFTGHSGRHKNVSEGERVRRRSSYPVALFET